MKLPIQITFRNMETSVAMEARARALVERLEKFGDDMTSCHVVIGPTANRQNQGALFLARIEITVPRGSIAGGASHRFDHSHEDPYVALRDAFRAARRQLEEYERKKRGQTKRSARERRRADLS